MHDLQRLRLQPRCNCQPWNPYKPPVPFQNLIDKNIFCLGDSLMSDTCRNFACAASTAGVKVHVKLKNCKQFNLHCVGKAEDRAAADLIVASWGTHYNNLPGSNNTWRYRAGLIMFLKLLGKENLPKLVWLETAAQHFGADGYNYNTAKLLSSCVPNKWEWFDRANWRNEIANPIMHCAGVDIVRTFNMSYLQHDDHIIHHFAWGRNNIAEVFNKNKNDCTHWCDGGILSSQVATILLTVAELKLRKLEAAPPQS
jgi:hypothetical protein